MFDFLKGTRPYFKKILFFYFLIGVVLFALAFIFWIIRDYPPFFRDALLAISSAILGSALWEAFKEAHDIYAKSD